MLHHNETKTEKAISLFKLGMLKESLAIFSRFRFGFTKEERRVLQISYECLTGNSNFYKSLGYDVEECLNESRDIIRKNYSFKKNEEQ